MSVQKTRHLGAVTKSACTAVLSAALLVSLTAGTAGASHASQVAQAKKGLLVLSDLPKGWKTSAGSGGGGGNFPGASQLASCIGVATSVLVSNPPSANSKEFDSKDGDQSVNDSVAVYPSSKDARNQYLAFVNSKTPGCMAGFVNGGSVKKQIQSEVGSGATVGTITAVKAPAANFVKNAAALTLNVPVVTQGLTVPLHITLVLGVKGKEAYQITLTSVGTSFPASLSKHLTSVAATRL